MEKAASLIVSVIQTNLHWEDKVANLRMLEEKIKGISEKTEIVILPEMFSTGFSMQPEKLAETMDGNTIAWMKRVAAEKRIILVGSVIINEPDADNNPQYFNRLVWVLPNGQYGVYDKRHLFGFAGEDKHYSAGEKRLIASVKGWKINLLVCYDLRFPVWARQQPHKETQEPEYDVLIYVANWPERRSHAWKTLLQARAIENQAYVIGVNRVGEDGNGIYHSGDTMIIDPLGEIIFTEKDKEVIHTVSLDRNHLQEVRSKFPFGKDGDEFAIAH